ncbi:Y-family DNA polymerase [Neorhodopirellula lusitana]|uniref:Y-family DNA polymerase n=1 Tax=Neorhodopirellula lusitana TaxID=445327 RepID=UPI00384CEA4C
MLCLWLPDWPIQRRLGQLATAKNHPSDAPVNNSDGCSDKCLVAAKEGEADPEPEVTPSPVVLWHSDPRRGRVVAAVCYRAINAGVRLGMPVAQAADLAAMTRAVFEEHDRDADRQALHQLAMDLQSHISPQTAIETLQRFKWHGRHRHDPEGIVSEIQGVTHLFDDETQLLGATAQRLRDHGYYARFAIADTLGAAWALANTARPKPNSAASGDGLVSRNSYFIAPPGRTVDALKTLPPAALRLSPDTVATLNRLGVESVDTLLRLPREGLATRLGMGLCDRIAQATGELDERILSLDTPSDHAATLQLEYPTDAMDLIADRLTRLIGQATAALHTLHRGVLRLQCQLQFTESPPVVLESALFAPTLDQSHLQQLMLGAFETHRLASKVSTITIHVVQHAPLSSRQPSIFGPDFETAQHDDWTRQTDAARLIDALSGRLGEDRVRGVRVGDDPLPESSIVDFPMSSHRARSTAKTKPAHRQFGISGSPQATDLGRRPLELLKQPAAITAFESESKSEDAGSKSFPVAFRIRGRNRNVVQRWGPERIETRWWNGPLIRRDYYRVELQDGGRVWVFCDLASLDAAKRWFLHGHFS